MLCCLAVLIPGPALAAFKDAPISAFYGTYAGTSVSSGAGPISKRDIGVSIEPRNGGFNVTWTTVTQKPDGRVKRKTYSIDFEPSRRENIYASAMRRDMFGHRVPLNPLKGDPYIWARVRGKTLTVFALHVTATGGYDLQIYERTLTKDGMHLEYSRLVEGVHERFVTGTLKRVSR